MATAKIVLELREFLETSGVTASELAKESGVTNAVISYLKSGKQADCRTETAEKLRKAMASFSCQEQGGEPLCADA
jgi:transcriptional regulator with XRE-family HTH domain